MNKIKAFTIIELIVVMLLSSMVIAIAYNGYTLFYKQFLSFRGSSDRIADVSLLDRLISSDMSESKIVLRKEQGMVCVYNDKVVQYQWTDDYVLRKFGAVNDTFRMEIGNVSFNFFNKNASEGKLIDEVVFISNKVNSQQKTFHVFKSYGADVLINNRE